MTGRQAARSAALAAAFLLAALWIYAPALRGPFVSDDFHYVRDNPAVHELSRENLWAIANPRSATSATVENWSPVHLLLHAFAWSAFGPDVFGHHLLNVGLHALGAALFALLLLRSGAREPAALLGGALFLAHPANVEAVAWISQLKSSAALVLSLLALLAFPRRPALATVWFALALLAKPTAAYALPVAGLLAWARPAPGLEPRRRTASVGWLALWALVLGVYAASEFALFHRSGQDVRPVDPDPWVRAATILANGGRYLLMAATGRGLSAFHEPVAIRSLGDPRLLGSLVAIGLLGARTLAVLRRRRPEAAYWVWAAVSFAPISQIFPFLYPVADRYLYFILPGLLGGAILAAQGALERLAKPAAARVVLAAGAALAFAFGGMAHARARIWTNPALLFADAAAHYPDGVAANLLRARRAAAAGEAAGAAEGLRAARERGFVHFDQILGDPAFAPVRGDARVEAEVLRMADFWIERLQRIDRPTQAELVLLGRALQLRGDPRGARAALERALDLGGPMDAAARAQLAELGKAETR